MLTIGQFSRACGVSIQTLRYYDQIDLITPDWIDPESNYRYYNQRQIPKLLLISRLKRYGFSLLEIQELMEMADSKNQLNQLENQKNVLFQEMQKQQIVLSEIENHILKMKQGANIMSYPQDYEIKLIHREPQAILSSRQKIGVDEMGKYFGILFETMQKEHLTPCGQTMTIYHDEEFNRDCSDMEVAIPIIEADKATRFLEGGECAFTIHRGAYSSLSDAYGCLVEWIQQNGYKSSNAPFEIYEKSFSTGVPIEEWETYIYFPIVR